MENKHNDNLEKIIDKSFKEMDLSAPSVNFTSNIMEQLELEKEGVTISYKPLISKPVWAIIFCLLIGVVIYSLLSTGNTENWFNQIDLSVLTNNGLTESLSNIKLSTTMSYGLVLFGVMFLIQIPLLKHHFNSRLEL